MTMHTPQQLDKMTKDQLAAMHVKNGGLMGFNTYRKWSKDELVNTIMQDEALAQLDDVYTGCLYPCVHRDNPIDRKVRAQ